MIIGIEKPKPNDPNQEWIRNEKGGGLKPRWTTGSVLPQSLIDLTDDTLIEEDDGDEDEVEFEELEHEEE